MSCVSISHGWIPRETSGSPAVSKLCYRGFVIHPLLSILLDNFITLQGTKVLEDHEVRRNFSYITEGAPQLQAFQSVVKYTGEQSAPRWMDIEKGNVFGFSDNFVRSLKSSRQVRDAVQCTGRSLHCSISDKARKHRQYVLHAEF